MATLHMEARHREQQVRAAGPSALDPVSAACALSVAVTLLLSTLLVWAKESYAPLHAFMASLTGHHWTTHGVADVLLLALLAVAFHRLGLAQRIAAQRLVMALIASVVVAGLGIAAFFVVF
jgi:hypothetical protein